MPPDRTLSSTSAPPAPATVLLETKLYLPKSRAALISRRRLLDRLYETLEHKLTVIAAPAGFGKTTLLADWLARETANGTAVGWVSLDPSDNEPTLFWAYVVAALQRALPGVGGETLSQLFTARPPSIESTLTALINDVSGSPSPGERGPGGEVILVLDDYHLIDESAIHQAVTFLLDHLPPRMHLVITTRAAPPLPLARLRAKGELVELGPADLRFTSDETSAFLNKLMELKLSPADVSKLEKRTEGWITGLKLAALSLKGRENAHQLVENFSGDNRYIADYLVEEALQAEPERTRHFLLSTSILARLSGPLCDAITGEGGSQALLESLERRNLFVVALDDRREWYRYHHLFAEVLEAYGKRVDPDSVRAAHLRAAAWYEENGSPQHAVRHAVASGDLERAAALLEKAWPEKNRSYETARWLERVKTLPNEVVRARPVLSMAYAWALMNNGELEAAEAPLRNVEEWLGKGEQVSGMVVTDHERFRSLPSELATARAYLAQSRGELPATAAQELITAGGIVIDDPKALATRTALSALALWAQGDLASAYEAFAEALDFMRLGGNLLDEIRGRFVLGDIKVSQGQLRTAARIYSVGLEYAAEKAPGDTAEIDDLYRGLSEVHREWGDLEKAAELLETVTQSSGGAAYRANADRWCTSMALVRQAQGDLKGAIALLEEAGRIEWRTPIPRIRPIAAMKARAWLLQGRVAEAQAWVRERGLSGQDDLSYLKEFEHLTLARVLLAAGASREAMELLDRLLLAAVQGGRAGSTIEILVLQSLAHQAMNDVRAALGPLERALSLAEPEGFLRVFVDEGTRVRDLLRQAAARGIGGEQARRVLAGFEEKATASSPASGAPSLTDRELEILRLIAAGMRNQEIADQLSISAATVKRHIANAYNKLGASHRTEALLRAKELNLL